MQLKMKVGVAVTGWGNSGWIDGVTSRVDAGEILGWIGVTSRVDSGAINRRSGEKN
jgi:hypothetical protein